ncbi:transcriptional regulator [Staphylococcus sp. IVB6246]|uniref:transcriptional regulator, SarA/Rot family n=2 Tax=unclassified Staphylococcus TaxID=91994 RepID=UPI0021CFCBB5|nr:MarR family transcriptional regulator [Staphylococcus sp. IVB6246]UXR68890.1 transcriptional regulator [Staphylococcus sp. IVB6246]
MVELLMEDSKVEQKSGIKALFSLQSEIESVFVTIAEKYELTKEELLILLTLWEKGGMTLKEMDQFVPIKSYKRSKTYNHLVNMKWIYKERPVNDERTVLIYYNEDMRDKQHELVTDIATEIKQHKMKMSQSFKKVLDMAQV